MGQLRFSMYLSWQLGLLIVIESEVIEIHLPFIKIYIALTKHARGVEIFGFYWEKKKMPKELKVGDSTDCFLGAVIRVPIEPYFGGDYRLEYDGKYITLFGKDREYPVSGYGIKSKDEEFEEMVLISCVLEVRNATPTIKEVTKTEIVIDLGCVIEPVNPPCMYHSKPDKNGKCIKCGKYIVSKF